MIDASGLIVMPGLVDLAARLREPGYEYRATLESEMDAAMAGGVTSLACPPDTDPPLDEPGLVEMLKHRAKSLNQARVYPVGALTHGLKGEELTEMVELTEAGCMAFSQADAPLTDTRVLMRAMQYAATFGYRVWLRPQDAFLAKDGVAHDGEVATRLGLPAIPVVRGNHCAFHHAATGARDRREAARLPHLQRGRRGDGAARQEPGLAADLRRIDESRASVGNGHRLLRCQLPPDAAAAQPSDDRAALRAGLLDGTIDAICSNHSPVDEDAKQLPFAEAEAGATGMELLLPLVLKWAAQSGSNLSDALANVTTKPARILGWTRATYLLAPPQTCASLIPTSTGRLSQRP